MDGIKVHHELLKLNPSEELTLCGTLAGSPCRIRSQMQRLES